MSHLNALVVDDHPGIAEYGGLILEQLGYSCALANNCAQARLLFDTLKPRLVVVDWNLEMESGVDLITELARQSGADVKFILCTGFPSMGLIMRAREAGAHAVCCKSGFRSEHLAIIRQVIAGAGWTLDPLAYQIAKRERLNDEEQAILRELALGVPTKESADRRGISLATAYRQQQEVMGKTGATSPLAWVDAARRQGVLPDEIERGLLR